MKSSKPNSYMLRSKKISQRSFKNSDSLIEKNKKKVKKQKDFSGKGLRIKDKQSKINNNLRRKNEDYQKQRKIKMTNFHLTQRSTHCLSTLSTIDSTKIKTRRKISTKIAFFPIKSLGNIPNTLFPKRSRQQNHASKDIIMTDNSIKGNFFENLERYFVKNTQSFEDKKNLRFILKYQELKIKRNFLSGKPKEIYSSLRCKTLCWMSELCEEFKFQRNTFYSAILYTDVFLSKVKSFEPIDYKLLAIAAMSLSSKFEEVYIQDLTRYWKKSDKFYEINQICEMEIFVLKTLEYNLGGPQINNILSFLLLSYDNFVIKNKLKVNYKNKKIIPLFMKESIESRGLINKITTILDYLILDHKIYEYNPFKLIICLIYITLLHQYSPFFKITQFQSYCSNKNSFNNKICDNNEFTIFTDICNRFMKEVAQITMNSLFKYFEFISNFLMMNIHENNEIQDFDTKKTDDFILQQKISYDNGIKIIQMIEGKNDS